MGTILHPSIDDETLSWKAVGILAWLRQTDESEWTLTALAARGPDGRSAVRAGLVELEQAGYITRTASGRIVAVR